MTQSTLFPSDPFHSFSPFEEMGAYEALWERRGTTFRKLAEHFRREPGALLSDLVEPGTDVADTANRALGVLRAAGIEHFGVQLGPSFDYPARLRDARHPVELLYYRGNWDLIASPSIAVVGTRKPSAEGREIAGQLARRLVEAGWTVMSGLAEGVDTAAHRAALGAGGHTIAVLGTPLSYAYPQQNRELQDRIAREHLIVSQVPVLRWTAQDYRRNRGFFPERNITMSALSRATVIVEAGETSGTLRQAQAALEQGRPLFIHERCFDTGLKWPREYERRGAKRFRRFEDLVDDPALAKAEPN